MYDPEQTTAALEHVHELHFHSVLWDYEFGYKETGMEMYSLGRFKS